jgi:hypothetical protein
VEVACFLLAVSIVVRALDADAVGAIVRHLGVNERGRVRAYVRELGASPDALLDALGLPPRDAWSPPNEEPVTLLEDDGWEPYEDDARAPLPNEGHPVFRRHQHRAWTVAPAAGALGAVAFFWAVIAEGAIAGWVGLGALALAAAGYQLGKRLRLPDICSGCEAPLAIGLEACPRCGGVIRGELGFYESHLDALERLGDVTKFGGEVITTQQDDADPRYVALGVACPHCGWVPNGEAHWGCDACSGPPFDTFATRARCPHCEEQHADTYCPACEHISPHAFWWPEGALGDDDPAD